ncbi:HupE/UreJ family protein [Schleiferia thermophila]|jgi:hypothetical protein|uniref:HupE/UreJ protein n=1 Tax=Schleiferia thermophila TaxID=884107 RepID=A0A368ZYF8_9FLAO|nr:HupE/UreJ family protein [Schleiferia thermophila]KFD38714.1 hypothetical protein AT05_08720 [Schleiferia thermophila str. Yellowstone]RCX02072.1 HupE/UreJ protein [Schleiferia thermophila]GCD80595.1 hypothetical protein JCM30197_18420 [Schleiferia thermophila]
MENFSVYFWLGYGHITDLAALDHILFLLVLIVRYQPRELLNILIVVTLFTIGHSLTLIVSALQLYQPSKVWIEFFIPITIVITAVSNLVALEKKSAKLARWTSFFFGLIHGFGFSNYYSMLTESTDSFWSALIPFNLGIEWGQLVVVAFILGISLLVQNLLNYKHRDWLIFVSGGGFSLALWLALENAPF